MGRYRYKIVIVHRLEVDKMLCNRGAVDMSPLCCDKVDESMLVHSHGV